MRGGGRKEEGSEGYYDCGEGEGCCCGARLAASALPALGKTVRRVRVRVGRRRGGGWVGGWHLPVASTGCRPRGN